MNKIKVGNAESPNLTVVRSKIGSLSNATHRPGGGDVKIENRKLNWSAGSRTQARNEKYVPQGGEKKVFQKSKSNLKVCNNFFFFRSRRKSWSGTLSRKLVPSKTPNTKQVSRNKTKLFFAKFMALSRDRGFGLSKRRSERLHFWIKDSAGD